MCTNILNIVAITYTIRFNIKLICFLYTQCSGVFVFRMILNKRRYFLKRIDWLVFVRETRCARF
jgi:hypothetical protein